MTNVVVLIRGESFRIGSQCSRKTCELSDSTGIQNQLCCFSSVNEFVIQPLTNLGFVCSIHIHTYQSAVMDNYINYFSNNIDVHNVSYYFENK